jgi:hypothetical protein
MSDVPDSTFRPRRVVCIAFAALAMLGGCLKPPTPTPSDPTSTGRVILTVHNNYRSDVNVYVIGDGQPSRVGTATAAATTSFDISARLLGNGRELRLRADPIGGRAVHTSELFRVGTGQRIDWTLETDLSRSTVAIY